MLFYGDCQRHELPRERTAAIRRRLLASLPNLDSARREWATSLLIEAGELIQGILDEIERAGTQLDAGEASSDFGGPAAACRDLALAAAQLYLAIYGLAPVATPRKMANARNALAAERQRGEPAVDSFHRSLARLEACRLPDEIAVRTPEGYAYYGVYPFLYALAARELVSWGCPWVVVGIRSIGTSLGAIVATAVGTEQLYFVRPTGPPLRRTLRSSPQLELALRASGHPAHYAVVDEGPGLSGSSFGAVADWLQHHGVSSGRIHFFPSHAGDVGRLATESHRERWKRAHRSHRAFEWYFDAARLRSRVFEGLPGEIRDISAGRWRSERYAHWTDWPPVHPALERRKYLLRSEKGGRIAKFVGLGAYGRAQVERAQVLHRCGFVPEPLAYREGFLLSTWCDAIQPRDLRHAARSAWLRSAGRYLGFIGNACRVEKSGASLEDLLNMACLNTGEALGERSALLVECRWRRRLNDIADFCAPVAIDGRLHAWEWLALADGRFLKADALEHHADHGLVGCQDLGWDIAGLRIEHDITAGEYDELIRMLVEHFGYRAQPEKEAFFVCCYLAYQMGYYELAAAAVANFDALEHRRATARRDFYAGKLRTTLEELGF